jgi:hypothetical protein
MGPALRLLACVQKGEQEEIKAFLSVVETGKFRKSCEGADNSPRPNPITAGPVAEFARQLRGAIAVACLA